LSESCRGGILVIRRSNFVRGIANIFIGIARSNRKLRNSSAAALWLLFCVFLSVLAPPLSAGDNWQPISPADLALNENPANPGDHAIILYREESLDDVAATVSEYLRIKIFDDQGKDLGNIRIPYSSGSSLKDFRARTILPDGTIVPFSGKTQDLVVQNFSTERVMERTIALSAVQPGCIIEYHYTIQRDPGYYYGATWNVQEDLFTRDAIFTIHPYPNRPFYNRVSQLPQDARPVRQKDDTYRMELKNISALVREELMPPTDMLRGRIEFFYRSTDKLSTDQFWKATGKGWNDELDKFVSAHKDEIHHEASGIVSPGDTEPVKPKNSTLAFKRFAIWIMRSKKPSRKWNVRN